MLWAGMASGYSILCQTGSGYWSIQLSQLSAGKRRKLRESQGVCVKDGIGRNFHFGFPATLWVCLAHSVPVALASIQRGEMASLSHERQSSVT
jgi:hypothetical protein